MFHVRILSRLWHSLLAQRMGHNCSLLDCFHLDTCHREQRLIIGVRSLNLSLKCQMGVMTASGSYLLECLLGVPTPPPPSTQNQMWTQGLQHQSDQLEFSDSPGSQAVCVIPKYFQYKQHVQSNINTYFEKYALLSVQPDLNFTRKCHQYLVVGKCWSHFRFSTLDHVYY